jgi:predicted nuclease of predicted toxin-antitoxin system
MMRVVLDQGLSPRAAALLRAEGWDAVHVMEIALDRAEDAEILAFAFRESRACITLDHDFHAHLARAQMAGPSVVFVRLEGLNAENQVKLIKRVWKVCDDAIAAGAAVSVDADSIRVRRLPIH